MNANELADEVLYRFADSGGNFYHEPLLEEVYNMLHWLHKENEALKAQYEQAYDEGFKRGQAEIEVLKANREHDFGLDAASRFKDACNTVYDDLFATLRKAHENG